MSAKLQAVIELCPVHNVISLPHAYVEEKGPEEFHLLNFPSNMGPPYSGSKNKPSNITAWSR